MFVRAAPFGYRIVSYSPSAAVVEVWSAGIIAGPARPATSEWETNQISVRWERDGWRLEGYVTSPGPTPAQGRPPDTSLMDSAKAYGAFQRVAP